MNLIKILLFITSMQHCSSARGIHKLIYQKDVSEHCRRRVFPSIFLGRQVMNANSQILQFSRLELPYSCFVSVRTESGSNIVMMIQLASNDLKKSCSKHSQQLLVYEMGETFGGYWGPLPDSVMKQAPPVARFYTIKTTHATTTNAQSRESEITEKPETIAADNTTLDENAQTEKAGDYVEVEIPIVNVSVHLVPSATKRPVKHFDQDMALDLYNDVTPIAGESYETSMIPLVQFSIHEDSLARRVGDDAPRYELDIVDYTPDIRLTLPLINLTKRRKPFTRRYQVTRRLNFKKHKNLIDTDKHRNRHVILRTFTKYNFPTKQPVVQETSTTISKSWVIVKDIIRKLKENVGHGNTIASNDEIILENIANSKHNKSAYLLPHWSYTTNKYNNNLVNTSYTTLANIHNMKINVNKLQSPSITINKPDKRVSLPSTYTGAFTKPLSILRNENVTLPQVIALQLNNSKEAVKGPKSTKITIRINESLPAKNNTARSKDVTITHAYTSKNIGSLVDRESWENLVQAAPEMVIKLNRTVGYDTLYNVTLNKTNDKLRKKKEIHAIYIDDARPHNLTTRPEKRTTTAQFQIADMQEFAQLAELQDNELHGRVALRYLRQYVGPALYNLCERDDSTQRHVHLFNSSRIVLAISNFTLDRMIIILTSARTLISGEVRCPSSHLECQVSGARVCLDSTVACDGIPNCGSYDIYDEDRLLCGASKGLQHNVYIVAFTFLAALLTVLYAVHYWLKRCVPKVADAFFVYTNGDDNFLYLDTIMRSPNDGDDNISKIVYQGNFLDDNIYDDLEISAETNSCTRFLKKCCFCVHKKQTNTNNIVREESEEERFSNMQQRLYSFTYGDNNMFATTNTAMQTGSSLEMKYLKSKKQKKDKQPQSPPLLIQDSILTLEEPLPKEEDELSLVKLFRDTRKNDSIGSVHLVKDTKPKEKEKAEIELKSYTYDVSVEPEPGPSGVRVKPEKKSEQRQDKHLRFDNVTTTIPFDDYHKENEAEDNKDQHRIAKKESKSRRPVQNLDTIEEDDEKNTTLKDAFHFWGTSKLRKPKKKSHKH